MTTSPVTPSHPEDKLQRIIKDADVKMKRNTKSIQKPTSNPDMGLCKEYKHQHWSLGWGWLRSVSRLWLSFCLACASLFVSLVPPVLVNCDMLDDHCYKAFIAKFAAKGFSLGCYFFLLVCVCVCVPALRVCCSLCLVIVAGFVWGLVCPHICCAWIGWDWGRCCFGVCVVCVGCHYRCGHV